MTKIQVLDPAMCCSTGVCGPTVDPALIRFAEVQGRLLHTVALISWRPEVNSYKDEPSLEVVSDKQIEDKGERTGTVLQSSERR